MGVSRQSLEQLRNVLNPLEIIREAVPTLRQSGNRWRGLCPFHNERTPSFFFQPDKGLWHCFGSCQEGGDVFKFIMRLEKLTFPEALRHLAQRAGMKLEFDHDSSASAAETSERERILNLLEQAARYYNETLLKSAEAEPARRYLAKRKIRPETVEKFQLGYAPSAGGFVDEAMRRAAPIEILSKAGLAVRSERTGRYHDPQRQRLTFPILDAYGRVVGFGGRVLDDEQQPKYLNSPETPVYSKGRNLYGLFHGRTALREKGQAVLVEGYMDVIGCHQAGMERAVAPLGTALTTDQAALLKRYVQEVVLLYDPDAAGTKASWRSSDVLIKADLYLRVAHIPGGKDPDEYVQEKGTQALEDRIADSQDVIDFWFEHIVPSEKVHGSLSDRVQLAKEILGLLIQAPNEMLRDEWLRKVSQRLSLDSASLRREMRKAADKPSAGPPAKNASSRRPSRMRSAEEEVFQLLCGHPEAWITADEFGEIVFEDQRCQRVWTQLRSRPGRESLDVAAFVRELDPEDGNWFSALLLEEKVFEDPDRALRDRLQRLRRMGDERERQSLGAEVLRMLEGKLPRDESKIARYQVLTRTLKGSEKKASAPSEPKNIS